MNPTAISDQEWKVIYRKLYAFTLYLLKGYNWFRRTGDDVVVQGKEADDYVMEAITRFLEAPEKFDENKRSLIGYLKNHILRNLVRRDGLGAENLSTMDVGAHSEGRDEEDGYRQFEELIPGISAHFDDEVDFRHIIADLCQEIAHDPEASLIFESICDHGKCRREVIAEQNWTDAIYDNAMKRLNRTRSKIVKKYKLIAPK